MKHALQCDYCKKQTASVFLTQVIEGKVKKINLCESCAESLGLNEPTAYNLTQNLLSHTSQYELPHTPLHCPICGFTQTDLKKTGRLGCSNCYSVFESQLTPMLLTMHKGLQHKGKVPARHRLRISRMKELDQLRADLEQAVQSEEYERAAGIRDRIRSLTKLVSEENPES